VTRVHWLHTILCLIVPVRANNVYLKASLKHRRPFKVVCTRPVLPKMKRAIKSNQDSVAVCMLIKLHVMILLNEIELVAAFPHKRALWRMINAFITKLTSRNRFFAVGQTRNNCVVYCFDARNGQNSCVATRQIKVEKIDNAFNQCTLKYAFVWYCD